MLLALVTLAIESGRLTILDLEFFRVSLSSDSGTGQGPGTGGKGKLGGRVRGGFDTVNGRDREGGMKEGGAGKASSISDDTDMDIVENDGENGKKIQHASLQQ